MIHAVTRGARRFAAAAGLRFLARRKGGASVAVLTMGLALGVNAATLMLVDGFLLSNLGIPDAGRLFVISPMRELPGRGLGGVAEAYPNYQVLREGQQAFADVASFHDQVMSWERGGELQPVSVARVTASFFPTMRIAPARGRTFDAADEGVSPATLAVVSDAFWRGRLLGDPAVIGSSVILNGVAHEVIGVMPPGFSHPLVSEVWLPFSLPAGQMTAISGGRVLGVYGRLRDDRTREAAQAEIDRLAGIIATTSPDNAGYVYRLRTLRELLIPGVDRIVLSIQAAALMLLALATINLASLLVAWAFDRRQEMAVRLALGASPGSIVRMNLLQSGVVIVAGLVVGIGVANVAIGVLRSMELSGGVSILLDGVALGPGIVAWGALGGAVAGIVATLVATLLASTSDLGGALRSASRSATLSPAAIRAQKGVVLAQAAISVVILFAAALMGISAYRLGQVPSGFVDADRHVGRVQFAGARYLPAEPRIEFVRRLEETAAEEPDIAAVAYASTLPVGDGVALGRFLPELPDGSLAPEPVLLNFRRVSANYLAVIGAPLLRGRAFESADGPGARAVAIVSRSLADRLWPGEDPIGQPLTRVVGADQREVRTVVGVVGDVVDAGYAAPPGETVYVPFRQLPHHRMSIVVVPRAAPEAALRAAARAVQAADPVMPMTDLTSLATLNRQANAVPRLQSFLLLTFACIAVAIVVLGSYGVMSQLVANREREFALRMVFGAERSRVVGLVFGQVTWLTVPGAAVGAAIGLLGSNAISPFLFGISARSAPVLAGVALLVVILALLATIPPALRAMRVDARRVTFH